MGVTEREGECSSLGWVEHFIGNHGKDLQTSTVEEGGEGGCRRTETAVRYSPPAAYRRSMLTIVYQITSPFGLQVEEPRDTFKR